MKSFNRDIYNKNLKDMRSLDKTEYKNTFYSWVLDIANGFSTEQSSSGVLDRNDIIQECYIAFENAWNNIDWDAIHEEALSEQAMIWAFLKKSIKNKVKNRITRFKDGVKVTWNNGVNPKSVDDFLTILFSEFHEDAKGMWDVSPSLWDVERLAKGLDEAMREKLPDVERLTLEYFYGIDCERVTLKDLADMYKTNQNAITVRKFRALKKLNNDDVKHIIRKNF